MHTTREGAEKLCGSLGTASSAPLTLTRLRDWQVTQQLNLLTGQAELTRGLRG